MYWKDDRLVIDQKALAEMARNDSERHLSNLPRDSHPYPFDPFSVNKQYVLLKDPEDIKMIWKPDIFIDQAIKIR
jgi:hypothetical protein